MTDSMHIDTVHVSDWEKHCRGEKSEVAFRDFPSQAEAVRYQKRLDAILTSRFGPGKRFVVSLTTSFGPEYQSLMRGLARQDGARR